MSSLFRRSLSITLAFAISLSLLPFITHPIAVRAQPPQPQRPLPQTAAASSDADLQARLSAIERVVEEKRKEYGVPGAALAIVKDDRVILLKGFGLKDVEKNLPVTPDTLFAIASSTKAFTAMAAAMSADSGKLSLDDNPRKHLPYFKLNDAEADARVTIRDLLANRTGLNRADLLLAFSDKLTREETIRIMGAIKPTAKLGGRWQYQNIMFSAAGEAVASAEGTTWEKDISNRIFKPLGMKSSNTSIREMQTASDFSYGYEYNASTKLTRRVPMMDLSSTAPDGAINSTARDMAQWLRLMLAGGTIDGRRLVSEKNFAELWKPHATVAPGAEYGLGWFLMSWRGKRLVEHGGNLPGFSAEVSMLPEEKLGLVLLTNVYASPLGDAVKRAVWSNLASTTAASPATPPSAAQPTSTSKPSTATATTAATAAPAMPANAAQEAGSYTFAEANAEVQVAFEGGQLKITLPGTPQLPLEYVENRQYRIGPPAPPGLNVTFRPTAASAGDTELLLETPQGKFTMPKVRPYAAPLSVEELMSKVIAAQGGAENLRKHKTLMMSFSQNFEQQGVTGEGVTWAKAPNMTATSMTLSALGKTLGTSFSYFDGVKGEDISSFSPVQSYTGKKLEAVKINADFYAPLNWRQQYKTITIKGTAKVGDEEVYVVEKVPERSSKITDYVSTKTFRILRRDTILSTDTSPVEFSLTTRFEDFRVVGGVTMPFRTVQSNINFGDMVTEVKEIKFDVEVPDSAFKPKNAGESPK